MKRIAQVVLGLVLGLAIAEAIFRWRDDGAFPHVNFYVADAELGVRLEPNATERLVVGTNPVTTANTNSQGFRGGEWPPPAEADVIIVGDSQVFGLGVEDDQTFSAKLGAINAGVPTYGPREYLATAAELVKKRGKARHVVFVLNTANDFFELDRPNRNRHAVWDGWAVRRETAPASVSEFPLRKFFMTRSHLVYAARRLMADATLLDVPLRSEGTWRDLVDESDAVIPARAEGNSKRDQLDQKLASAVRDLPVPQREDPPLDDFQLRGEGNLRGLLLDDVLKAQPGDIVTQRLFEAGRPVTLTAQLIQEAGNQLALAQKEREQERADLIARLEQERGEYRRGRAVVQAERWSLPPRTPPLPRTLEGFRTLLLDFQEAQHVEVTLLLLPLDLQVSDDEWKKYGQAPRSMTNSIAYGALLAESLRASGIRTVEPLGALSRAEPGVFLDGDLHLTAKGHAVVAAELKAALALPAPAVTGPRLTLVPPSPAEWDEIGENTVVGSSALACETKELKGWLRVLCRTKHDRVQAWEALWTPRAMTLTSGSREDAWVAPASLMIPLGDFTAQYEATDPRGAISVWELHSRPRLEFVKVKSAPVKVNGTAAVTRALECSGNLVGDEELYGDPSAECLEAFGARCSEYLACVQGHPSFRPPCASGWTASGRCR